MQFKDIVLIINLNTLTAKFSEDEPLPSKVLIEWIRGNHKYRGNQLTHAYYRH